MNRFDIIEDRNLTPYQREFLQKIRTCDPSEFQQLAQVAHEVRAFLGDVMEDAVHLDEVDISAHQLSHIYKSWGMIEDLLLGLCRAIGD